MQDRRIILALSLIAALGLFVFVRSHESSRRPPAGSPEANPPVGVPCAIELRPPLPGAFSSAYLKGTLRLANDRWLVLHNDEKPAEGDVWITRESVMLIVTGKSARTYHGFETKLGQ